MNYWHKESFVSNQDCYMVTGIEKYSPNEAKTADYSTCLQLSCLFIEILSHKHIPDKLSMLFVVTCTRYFNVTCFSIFLASYTYQAYVSI